MKKYLLAAGLALASPAPQDPAVLIEELRSDEIAVRDRAFVELEKLGGAAEAALRKAAADRDATVALHAARLLRLVELRRVLSPALKNEFPDLYRRLARSAGEEWTRIYLAVAEDKPGSDGKPVHGALSRADLEPLAAPAIRHAIASDDKISACGAAARWFHKSAKPAVIDLLRDPEDSVRRAACKTLVALIGREALPAILESLRDAPILLVDSIHWFDARTAFEAQGRLENLLRHPDGEVVAAAVRALRELDVTTLIPEIRGLLKSKSPPAKIAALDFLDQFDVRDAAEDAKALVYDPDRAVRDAAARFLWGFKFAVPTVAARRLLEESESDNPSSFLQIIPAAAGKDPALLEAVRKQLKHPNADVPPIALQALRRLEDPGLEEICIEQLNCDSAWLRREALNALASSGSRRAVSALHQVVLDPTRSAELRCSAFDTLTEMKALPPQESLVKLLADSSVQLASRAAFQLASSAPELVRVHVPRLLQDEGIRTSSELWTLAGLMDPPNLGPLLLKALEDTTNSPWYVQRAIAQLKLLAIIPDLRALLSNEKVALVIAAMGALAELQAVEARPDAVQLLDSPVSDVRRAAVHALSEFGLGAEVGMIRRLTGDSDVRVRVASLAALRRAGAKEAIPDFVKCLEDRDRDVVELATKALVEWGSRETTSRMLDWFGRRDDWSRPYLAEKVLAVTHPAAAESAILAKLDHRDADVRSSGAWELQKFGMKSHARRLLALMEESQVAEDAAKAIVVLDARECIPELEVFLSDASPVRRSAALDALTGLASIKSAPRFRKMLDDPDLDIRRKAALGLGLLGDRSAVPRLIEMLSDPVRGLRVAAARALGESGDVSAAEALVSALGKSELGVFVTSVSSLSKLQAVQAAPELLRLLRDRHSELPAIMEALGALGSKEAIPELVRLLEEPRMAGDAARALARLGATEAIPAIRRRMEEEHRDDFMELATSLADLGDPSGLVEALTNQRYQYRAALELCSRGDSRGVPELLRNAEPWYGVPPEFNAVRKPKVWKALKDKPWKGQIQACRLRVVERIGAAAGLKVRWEGAKSFDELAWPYEWESAGWIFVESSLLQELMDATNGSSHFSSRTSLDSPPFGFILEEDSIRILPRDEALKFWKTWWADEQAKLKK